MTINSYVNVVSFIFLTTNKSILWDDSWHLMQHVEVDVVKDGSHGWRERSFIIQNDIYSSSQQYEEEHHHSSDLLRPLPLATAQGHFDGILSWHRNSQPLFLMRIYTGERGATAKIPPSLTNYGSAGQKIIYITNVLAWRRLVKSETSWFPIF